MSLVLFVCMIMLENVTNVTTRLVSPMVSDGPAAASMQLHIKVEYHHVTAQLYTHIAVHNSDDAPRWKGITEVGRSLTGVISLTTQNIDPFLRIFLLKIWTLAQRFFIIYTVGEIQFHSFQSVKFNYSPSLSKCFGLRWLRANLLTIDCCEEVRI